jgi:PPOX class probable F420-dependent enzyme
MSTIIPATHQYLLEAPLYTTFISLMSDGSPQASVVWRLWQAPYLWVSSHKHSQKVRNCARDPRVTLLTIAPDNPYCFLEIRGRVEEIIDDGEYTILEQMAHFYLNMPYYGGAEPLAERGRVAHVALRIALQKVLAVSYPPLQRVSP